MLLLMGINSNRIIRIESVFIGINNLIKELSQMRKNQNPLYLGLFLIDPAK